MWSFEPSDKKLDLWDKSLTENTRACYPLEFIENASSTGIASHPKTLYYWLQMRLGFTPISKLSPEQAMYHFLSGYTAKVAGTEKEWEVSLKLLSPHAWGTIHAKTPNCLRRNVERKLSKHGGSCWLVNTGWSGGSVADGAERMKISYTRAMLRAALDGKLDATPINSTIALGWYSRRLP